jgi:hypothetical protein
LTTAVSRKTHGSAGTFDIGLPLTGPTGIECRSGGTQGNFTMVFTFATPLASVGSASVTGGTGSISSSSSGPDSHEYVVNLTGVTNVQRLGVKLTNVADTAGGSSATIGPVTMGVLLGDINGNGLVDGNDVSAVQSQTRQPVSGTNFRDDVNANGIIDGNDVSTTQAQTRTSLP